MLKQGVVRCFSFSLTLVLDRLASKYREKSLAEATSVKIDVIRYVVTSSNLMKRECWLITREFALADLERKDEYLSRCRRTLNDIPAENNSTATDIDALPLETSIVTDVELNQTSDGAATIRRLTATWSDVSATHTFWLGERTWICLGLKAMLALCCLPDSKIHNSRALSSKMTKIYQRERDQHASRSSSTPYRRWIFALLINWNDIRVFEVLLNGSIGFVDEHEFVFVENEQNRLMEIRVVCQTGRWRDTGIQQVLKRDKISSYETSDNNSYDDDDRCSLRSIENHRTETTRLSALPSCVSSTVTAGVSRIMSIFTTLRRHSATRTSLFLEKSSGITWVRNCFFASSTITSTVVVVVVVVVVGSVTLSTISSMSCSTGAVIVVVVVIAISSIGNVEEGTGIFESSFSSLDRSTGIVEVEHCAKSMLIERRRTTARPTMAETRRYIIWKEMSSEESTARTRCPFQAADAYQCICK